MSAHKSDNAPTWEAPVRAVFGVSGWAWSRASEYEVRGGRLAPVEGADVSQYDPWRAYSKASIGRGSSRPPYGTLMDLCSALQLEDVLDSPAPSKVDKLTAWTKEHGLLGILPHRVSSVSLARRWRRPLPEAQEQLGLIPTLLYPVTRRAVFRYGRWVKSEFPAVHTPASRGTHGVREGDLVDELGLADEYEEPIIRAYAVVHDWRFGEDREEPLSMTWAEFFRGVPQGEEDTHEYPLPGDAEFWARYAEPVFEFANASVQLAQGLGLSSQLKRSTNDRGYQQLMPKPQLPVLDRLAAVMTPRSQTDQLSFEFPSLLSAYAVMAILDVTKHRRVLVCSDKQCRHVFVTRAYQGRWCSKRCRDRTDKETKRAKARRAENARSPRRGK